MRWIGLLIGAVVGYAVFLNVVAPLIGVSQGLRALGSGVAIAAGGILADRLMVIVVRRRPDGTSLPDYT